MTVDKRHEDVTTLPIRAHSGLRKSGKNFKNLVRDEIFHCPAENVAITNSVPVYHLVESIYLLNSICRGTEVKNIFLEEIEYNN